MDEPLGVEYNRSKQETVVHLLFVAVCAENEHLQNNEYGRPRDDQTETRVQQNLGAFGNSCCVFEPRSSAAGRGRCWLCSILHQDLHLHGLDGALVAARCARNA